MSRERFVNPWSSEEEIAAVTRQALESLGWIVHPETGGFDLLAVAGEDCRTQHAQAGDILGVECKLDAGTLAGVESLLRQVLPTPKLPPRRLADLYRPEFGVHFRAAVSARFRCEEVFRRYGVTLVEAARWRWCGSRCFERVTVERLVRHDFISLWPRFAPERTPYIPEIVIDVPAGVPSPQTSSKWKVAAVRIMLRLANELLTSDDFRAVGLNPGTFRQQGWIADSGIRKGRAYLWTIGADWRKDNPPPHLRYPEIVTALRAKDAVEGAA